MFRHHIFNKGISMKIVKIAIIGGLLVSGFACGAEVTYQQEQIYESLESYKGLFVAAAVRRAQETDLLRVANQKFNIPVSEQDWQGYFDKAFPQAKFVAGEKSIYTARDAQGALLGMLILGRISESARLEINNLSVDPVHWRKKVGSKLFSHALQLLTDSSSIVLQSKVRPSNEPWFNFLKSFGFKEDESETKKFRDIILNDPKTEAFRKAVVEDALVVSTQFKGRVNE